MSDYQIQGKSYAETFIYDIYTIQTFYKSYTVYSGKILDKVSGQQVYVCLGTIKFEWITNLAKAFINFTYN